MGLGGDAPTVGFKYRIGMHMGLCHGPVDALERIVIADREAWSGSSAGGRITIDAPELFGGDGREGGVSGDIDLLMGASGQGVNDYLTTVLDPPVPAFRGLVSLVLRQFYIGNNPYLKNWRFRLRRTQTSHDGSPIWQPAIADIAGDMNPAHIVRECLLSQAWGLGVPANMLDDAAFQSAAQTLYAEDFGLSFLWTEQESVEAFIQRVLDHINARLYVSPRSGLFVLKLIRHDYVVPNLPRYDESNVIAVESFERRGWGETVNELIVVCTDPDSGGDVPITLHHQANIQMQGEVVSQVVRYPGIRNAALAARVGQRDLIAMASPLARLRLRVSRSGWDISPGDAFRFAWAGYGVAEMVVRVARIDQGGITDGPIVVDAIEDVFAMPAASYVEIPTSAWKPPNTTPQPAVDERVVELPYWDVVRTMTAAQIADLDLDFGFIAAIAVSPPADYYGFRLYVSGIQPGVLSDVGWGDLCPTAALVADIGQADGGAVTNVMLELGGVQDLDEVSVGSYAYIDDEIVAIKSVDLLSSTITVDRAVLDTVPAAHLAGARVWFGQQWRGVDPTERVAGELAAVKVLTNTSAGALPEAQAALLTITLDNRFQRPYPPGNFQIGGQRYPAAASGDLVLTWAHRDRTQQTASLTAQSVADIGPEPGTEYIVSIYENSGATPALVREQLAITATTWTYLQADRITDFGGPGPHDVLARIRSTRGGYESLQAQECGLTVTDI